MTLFATLRAVRTAESSRFESSLLGVDSHVHFRSMRYSRRTLWWPAKGTKSWLLLCPPSHLVRMDICCLLVVTDIPYQQSGPCTNHHSYLRSPQTRTRGYTQCGIMVLRLAFARCKCFVWMFGELLIEHEHFCCQMLLQSLFWSWHVVEGGWLSVSSFSVFRLNIPR